MGTIIALHPVTGRGPGHAAGTSPGHPGAPALTCISMIPFRLSPAIPSAPPLLPAVSVPLSPRTRGPGLFMANQHRTRISLQASWSAKPGAFLILLPWSLCRYAPRPSSFPSLHNHKCIGVVFPGHPCSFHSGISAERQGNQPLFSRRNPAGVDLSYFTTELKQ